MRHLTIIIIIIIIIKKQLKNSNSVRVCVQRAMDILQWHIEYNGGHKFHSQLKIAEHSVRQYPIL